MYKFIKQDNNENTDYETIYLFNEIFRSNNGKNDFIHRGKTELMVSDLDNYNIYLGNSLSTPRAYEVQHQEPIIVTDAHPYHEENHNSSCIPGRTCVISGGRKKPNKSKHVTKRKSRKSRKNKTISKKVRK
jgi:hypothetical protein